MKGRAIRRGREGRGAGWRSGVIYEDGGPREERRVWLGHVELGGPRGRHSMHWLDVETGYCWGGDRRWAGPALPLPQAKPPRAALLA